MLKYGLMKAIGLLSGGLDSRLALKLMLNQGVEVIALHYITPFCTCTAKSSCKLEARKAAEEYGLPLKVFFVFDDFIEIIKKPKYGHGSGINPCLDCRILMFKKAKQIMEDEGASFIVTGEVLGERPMSQRLDAIKLIERESGLSGLIVRPLSAKHFTPSIPEQEGWVNRDEFLAIKGRSRKPQMALAEKLGLKDYPCAAGGCLLTDKVFAQKMRWLLQFKEYPTKNDVLLLKVGRHFSTPDCFVIVGRNEKENFRLESLAQEGDYLLKAVDFLGPTTLLRGAVNADLIKQAAALTAWYGKGREQSQVKVSCQRVGSPQQEEVVVNPQSRTLALATN